MLAELSLDRMVALCFLEDELSSKLDLKAFEYNLNAKAFLNPIDEFVFPVLVGPLIFVWKHTLFGKRLMGRSMLSKLFSRASHVLSQIPSPTEKTPFSSDHP